MSDASAVHRAEERLQTILKAVVVGARAQDPASRPGGEEVALLNKELEQLKDKLRILLLPKDPLDEKNTLLEIRAGTGGEEAALFGADLMRAYCRYAERRKWKVELLTKHETGIGGMKEVVLMITGDKPPPHGNDWASYEVYTLKSGQVVKGVYIDRKARKFKTLDGGLMILDNSEIDWRKHERKTYVSFPPGPAVLMLPLVYFKGYEANDVLFTIFFAALSVMLVYMLMMRLRSRGIIALRHSDVIWLTVMFGLGSVHLWCSVLGQVWFTALVLGGTFTLLYLHASVGLKHPILAGFFLACAFACRTPLVFSAVFFFGLALFPNGRFIGFKRRRLLKYGSKIALFCIFPLAVGLTLLWMNVERFENPFEFGHTYLAAGGIARIQKYGLFNYHFISKNLAAAFVLMPRIQPSDPYVIVSKHGMSLFITMPCLFYLFFARTRAALFGGRSRSAEIPAGSAKTAGESQPDETDVDLEASSSPAASKKTGPERPEATRSELKLWHRLLWVTALCIATPIMLYQNTGWEQFGFRFAIDFWVYLLLLLAIGRTRLSLLFKVLIVFGIIVNAFGAITFKRVDEHYDNWFFDPDRF